TRRRDGTGTGTFPVMLGAVKMEGHEAPDWSGYYSEEVYSPMGSGLGMGSMSGYMTSSGTASGSFNMSYGGTGLSPAPVGGMGGGGMLGGGVASMGGPLSPTGMSSAQQGLNPYGAPSPAVSPAYGGLNRNRDNKAFRRSYPHKTKEGRKEGGGPEGGGGDKPLDSNQTASPPGLDLRGSGGAGDPKVSGSQLLSSLSLPPHSMADPPHPPHPPHYSFNHPFSINNLMSSSEQHKLDLKAYEALQYSSYGGRSLDPVEASYYQGGRGVQGGLPQTTTQHLIVAGSGPAPGSGPAAVVTEPGL
ncbi:LOW QUALITY PROTEIN: hepatocyte nuclear factor 3-alpha, partial [Scomber scombrus]